MSWWGLTYLSIQIATNDNKSDCGSMFQKLFKQIKCI